MKNVTNRDKKRMTTESRLHAATSVVGKALLGSLPLELRCAFGHLTQVMPNGADGHHKQGLGSAI